MVITTIHYFKTCISFCHFILINNHSLFRYILSHNDKTRLYQLYIYIKKLNIYPYAIYSNQYL